MSDGQQAGHLEIGNIPYACVWSGTADSWVNLHPGTATRSQVTSTHRGKQAGDARVNGNYHSSVWYGSAAAWIDLRSLLPAEFTSSHARGIWSDGSTVSVVGYGENPATGRLEAFLWTIPCPADYNGDGFLSGDDFDLFVADFESGTMQADINFDGFLTGDDFDLFVEAFSRGC